MADFFFNHRLTHLERNGQLVRDAATVVPKVVLVSELFEDVVVVGVGGPVAGVCLVVSVPHPGPVETVGHAVEYGFAHSCDQESWWWKKRGESEGK